MTCTNFPHCIDSARGCNRECEMRQTYPPTVAISRDSSAEGTVWTIPAEAVKLLESEMDQ